MKRCILAILLFLSFINDLVSYASETSQSSQSEADCSVGGIQCSDLWGAVGENWDTNELPDFTNVGYKGGSEPIPSWPVGVSVKDPEFGALGDGVHDDTDAINAAIEASPDGHAVLIPNGTYIITDYIKIERDNVVIRGQDRDKTILKFPHGLRHYYGLVDDDGKEYKWQFNGGFFSYSGGTHRSLENFTIEFPNTQFEDHFSQEGTNAIEISGMEDSWIRSIRILNANAGISLRGGNENVTVLDIEFNNGDQRQNGRSVGHSGIKVKDAQFNLIHNVTYKGAPYEHELNTNGAQNNVFSRFSGSNMQMDWHGGPIKNNLWTEFNLGLGEPAANGRPTFRSGGENEVLWGINSVQYQHYNHVYRIAQGNQEKRQGADLKSMNIVVGLKTQLPTDTDTSDEYWHEAIDPEVLHPQNIFLAQLERLQKPLPQSFQAEIEQENERESELCVPLVIAKAKTVVICL